MTNLFTQDIQTQIDKSLAHPDVREGLRGLINTAILLHAQERSISLLSVRLVGLLHERNGAGNSVLSREGFAWTIGLTPNTFWKRTQAYRVLSGYPDIAKLVESGETAISHVAMLAPHITPANAAVLSAGMRGKSTRELRDFIATVRPDGSVKPEADSYVEIKLRLSTTDAKLIDRAQEVLGHRMSGPGGGLPTKEAVIIRAMSRLLEQQDPMRQAARAADRKVRIGRQPSPSARKAMEPGVSATGLDGNPSRLATKRNMEMAVPATRQSIAGAVAAGRLSAATAQKNRRPSIPHALCHQVWLRDQGRCTHDLGAGLLCGSRYRIEIDHEVPWAKGGIHTLDNLALKCRPHHQLAAQQVFGKEFMASFRQSARAEAG